MPRRTTLPVFKGVFTLAGQDESRHLAICLKMLEDDWPGLTEDYKNLITKQLRAGFVFLFDDPVGAAQHVLGAATVLSAQPSKKPMRYAR